MELPQQPKLILSDRISIPAVIAFGHPRILIPEQPVHRPEAEWFSVFCHELAHVLRGDAWGQLLIEIVRVVLPWQPFVWLLRREHGRACENACDDWVVSTGTDPLDFATALANWIPRRTPRLVLGMGGRFSESAQRIARLLKMEAPPNPRMGTWRLASSATFFGLLAVLIALTQTATPQLTAEETTKPNEARTTTNVKSTKSDAAKSDATPSPTETKKPQVSTVSAKPPTSRAIGSVA